MTHPETTPLMDFLLIVLASVMTPGLGDPGLARRAAQQAIEAYQPHNTHELIATGQILGFALTALETLRQSTSDSLSPSMQLKFRGNANGLNRSARDNTRVLDTIRDTQPNLAGQAAMAGWPQPAPPPQPAAKPGTPEKDRQMWADAMQTVAARLQASTPAGSPNQQKVNALWVDALTGVAAEIAQGTSPAASPGLNRMQLLRTTRMTGLPLADPPKPERRG